MADGRPLPEQPITESLNDWASYLDVLRAADAPLERIQHAERIKVKLQRELTEKAMNWVLGPRRLPKPKADWSVLSMVLRPDVHPNDLAAWKARLEDLRNDPPGRGRDCQIELAQDMVDILEGRTPAFVAADAPGGCSGHSGPEKSEIPALERAPKKLNGA